jgi:excinuclease ABC subunit A
MVVANSDWVIDIGPGAGDQGGTIVAQGIPEDVAKSKQSKTAPYLRNSVAINADN